jgi:hypothetical protein
MQLANSTIYKFLGCSFLILALNINILAQDNSPYSRYGIGDLVNYSSILSRGMGSASIAFGSERFINITNPASYSYLGFNAGKGNGNLISFEVGSEFSSRTLNQGNPVGKYNSKNLLFNYMQLGMQVGKNGNWGVTFGLIPIARENYKIENTKRIPNIDSALTVFEGSGGTYRAMIGTGYRKKQFSFGINTGYTFGKKEVTTNRKLLNDSIQYYETATNTKTSYGNIFLQTGLLYNFVINKTKTLQFGATYELQTKLKAKQDVERLVYDNDNLNNPAAGIDSIFVQKEVAGTIVMPATIGFGVNYKKIDTLKNSELMLAADFTTTNWNNYRFYGQKDQVKTNWAIKTGFEWLPAKLSNRYWSTVHYRGGFNYGNDYITAAGKTMPVYALTFGLGLPIPTSARVDKSIIQPVINLAIEAGKRGDKSINLRENFVKVSLSVSLADIWFFRRKFD